MEYVVYKITNNINGKYYIGLHETLCWKNSKYFGSGTRLKNEISLYGKSNFYKEALFIFDNKQEMLAKEADLVTPELLSDPLCLNMVSGGKRGKNGWGFSKKNVQRKRTNPKKLTDNK